MKRQKPLGLKRVEGTKQLRYCCPYCEKEVSISGRDKTHGDGMTLRECFTDEELQTLMDYHRMDARAVLLHIAFQVSNAINGHTKTKALYDYEKVRSMVTIP